MKRDLLINNLPRVRCVASLLKTIFIFGLFIVGMLSGACEFEPLLRSFSLTGIHLLVLTAILSDGIRRESRTESTPEMKAKRRGCWNLKRNAGRSQRVWRRLWRENRKNMRLKSNRFCLVARAFGVLLLQVSEEGTHLMRGRCSEGSCYQVNLLDFNRMV